MAREYKTIQFIRQKAPYRTGEVAGFPAHIADRHVRGGIARYYKPEKKSPSSMETTGNRAYDNAANRQVDTGKPDVREGASEQAPDPEGESETPSEQEGASDVSGEQEGDAGSGEDESEQQQDSGSQDEQESSDGSSDESSSSSSRSRRRRRRSSSKKS